MYGCKFENSISLVSHFIPYIIVRASGWIVDENCSPQSCFFQQALISRRPTVMVASNPVHNEWPFLVDCFCKNCLVGLWEGDTYQPVHPNQSGEVTSWHYTTVFENILEPRFVILMRNWTSWFSRFMFIISQKCLAMTSATLVTVYRLEPFVIQNHELRPTAVLEKHWDRCGYSVYPHPLTGNIHVWLHDLIYTVS